MQRSKGKAPNGLQAGSGLNVEVTNVKGINMSNNTTQGGKNQDSLVLMHSGMPATTTLAISHGTRNEHKSVIQLVRNYRADLEEFGGVTFEMRPFETAGGKQEREVAILNEQQSTLILTYMRNSEIVRTFKKALVKAFFELANSQKQVDPMQVLSDPAAMRGLLLGYTEKVIKLEGQVNYLAPKAEALDRIATAGGSMCIRDAAKTLQVQEGKLAKLLVENKWIYQRPMGTGKLAYSDKLQAGLMEHKITQGNKPDGSEWVSTQPRITAKGLTKLSQMLQSPEVAA